MSTKLQTKSNRAVSVDEVADALGVGRTTTYKAIKDGTFPLPIIRLGRRILVSRAALERLLAGDESSNTAMR